VVTRTCLDLAETRSKRALPVDLGLSSDRAVIGSAPLADVAWLGPYPDAGLAGGPPGPGARYEQREAVELAFVAALQHLPGSQRAALLLFEVLGYSAAETMSGTTEPELARSRNTGLTASADAISTKSSVARALPQRRMPARRQPSWAGRIDVRPPERNCMR
jgi:RNA polymerase sigma-70 factor (ECF subfamily)